MTNAEIKKQNEMYNEGGEGYNKAQQEQDDKQWQAEKEVAAEIAALHAEWTKEVTIERRAEFNARKPTRATLEKITKELGFSYFDLTTQIKRHGL